MRGVPEGHTPVSFVTQSEQRSEDWTDEQFSYAVIEIWLLSFSDNLLITDHSTFGWTAAALAGIRPYTMDIGVFNNLHLNWKWHRKLRPVCFRTIPEPTDEMGDVASRAMCSHLRPEDYAKRGIDQGYLPTFGITWGEDWGLQAWNVG
eukprot:TRINITY_DN7076_c0_g2_i2.p1 TRINITY_DN7076_c0_g2~~TRINITY_DN7076_c0_g2_i2.p1  ORF type:complete len:148 (+),score=0.91 TRINITY_DN7076_c0_g2_i2:367-810(+)